MREQIETILTDTFNPIKLDVVDKSHLHKGHAGAKEHGGGHYDVLIVSDVFTNKNNIKRHREVYKALDPFLANHKIHAVSIRAYTPHEWEQPQ